METMMKKLILATAALALLAAPALAQSQQELNYMRDSARAQERQADYAERSYRVQRDRAWAEDRAQRNFERDSRSSRRFDR
jgi:Ni/Co efflux regulator RcnB